MRLPPELIDEIFSHLSLDEPQTLRNCSLVAKSWVYRSQKRLFETIHISELTHSSWANSISPANLELLHHVHFLTLHTTTWWCHIPVHGIHHLSDYLPSLYNLESLVLSLMHLRVDFSQIKNFSAFRLTLSSLSLRNCHLSTYVLITLVNYFPNLVDLELRIPIYVGDYHRVPPLSRPLHGRLSVQTCGINLPLFDELSDLPPELDELFLGGGFQGVIQYDHMVATYAGSVKCLRLLCGFNTANRPTLSHCRKLRELKLSVKLPTQGLESLITSITSTDLQKIVVSVHTPTGSLSYSKPAESFNTIDNSLCQLVDQLRESGYKRTLEVEFQVWRLVQSVKGIDFEKSLPKFQEKGRVRITQMSAWMAANCCCS